MLRFSMLAGAGLLLLTLAACTTSSRVAYLEMPDETLPPADLPDVAAYDERYGEYDGVYLLYETTVEHSGVKERPLSGSPWTYSWVNRERYIIFDPTDEELTSFRVYGVPDNLYVRLIDPDGTMRTFGLDDLSVEKDSDGDTRRVLVFPDVDRGTFVDLGWEMAIDAHFYRPPLSQDVPFQFSYPCESLSFRFAYPDWWTLAIKRPAPDREIPLVRTVDPRNKKNILTYTAADLPPIEDEIYAPYFKQVADYLQFHVATGMIGGAPIQVSSTWQELFEDLQEAVLDDSGKYEDTVASKAEELTAGLEGDVARADAILTFVQREIDPNGGDRDGNHKKILSERSGNVFDVTSLTQALLLEAGLPAYLLLVHSAEDGYFDPEYVSFDQFQFIAVRAVLDGEDYVLFPYFEDLPLNHTPRFVQGQMALQATARTTNSSWDTGTTTSTGDATLWRLPPGNRSENLSRSVFAIAISEWGDMRVEETRTFNGAAAYALRQQLKALDADEEKDVVEEMLTYTDGDVELVTWEIRNQRAYKEPLHVDITYTIDNLVMVTPEEVIFQTGGLLSPLTRRVTKVDVKERQNPIQIAFDEQHDKEITITFPTAWRLTREMTDIDYANDFGSILATYETSPGQLVIMQQAQLHRIETEAARFPELLELVGERSRLSIPTIVFTVEPEV